MEVLKHTNILSPQSDLPTITSFIIIDHLIVLLKCFLSSRLMSALIRLYPRNAKCQIRPLLLAHDTMFQGDVLAGDTTQVTLRLRDVICTRTLEMLNNLEEGDLLLKRLHSQIKPVPGNMPVTKTVMKVAADLFQERFLMGIQRM